jgi:hypothetical protein
VQASKSENGATGRNYPVAISTDEGKKGHSRENRGTEEGRIDMTRQVLTTIGSAAAVTTAVSACLLLGPTAQAQAAPACPSMFSGVIFIPGCIGATSGGNVGYVDFGSGMACAKPAGATVATCKPLH